MPVRSNMEQLQYATKENAVAGARSSTVRQTGSCAQSAQDAAAQQIIECRKKSSSGESVVTHRFRKGRLLGKGGFAHCYKVTCLDSERVHALKIVPKSTLVKSRARQKLQTEIKIHRTLQHPRIVRFEMFFEDRENVYILLELCNNHSLSELIRKTKRFTEDEARRYMLQILEATSYLHRHQIIHRDLKLGNVFLDRDWNIKMGDFGLATKLVKDSERKRTICGTPNYIAPEILEGTAGHSYQVDLWSAGVILYTMLVGRPPYESTDVKSTYRRILANVYAFPESVPVSDNAKNLVGRLLQVKPEQRPSLDEILNHPFLRNGGPRQRFSTAHGLRGSSSSSTTDPAAAMRSASSKVISGTACAVNGGSASSAGRVGQKLTPERYGAGGAMGRPPLKTRSSNVDAEGGEVAQQENVRAVKPRVGVTGPIGRAGGDGGGDALGGRPSGVHGLVASKRSSASSRPGTSSVGAGTVGAAGRSGGVTAATSAAMPSTRSAVPRTGSSKGFDVYCDAGESGGSAGGSSGPASRNNGLGATSGTSYAQQSKRPGSTAAGGNSRQREGKGDRRSGESKSPVGGKENRPGRAALGSGGGSGARSAATGARDSVNAPILSRRPLVRSASSTVDGSGSCWVGATVSGGSGGGVCVDGSGGKGPGGRRAGLRRSATTVGTQAERGIATARGGSHGFGRPGVVAGSALGMRRGVIAASTSTTAVAKAAAGASPRVRSSVRGIGSRTGASSSPYRSPTFAGCSPAGDGGGQGFANARAGVSGGDGTPRGAVRKSAQQRLDFGGTPRSSRQRTPVGTSSSAGKIGRSTRRTPGDGSGSGSVARGTPSPKAAIREGGGVTEKAASTAVASDRGGSRGLAADIATVDLNRDTLENMHDVLTSSFALGEKEEASSRPIAARGTRSSVAAAAAARAAAAAVVEAETPPSVWVTRYVDYSSKYGLGFLLSDGSAGVYFNDATKIVLEPAGVAFDYIERARRSSPAVSRGRDGARADGSEHPPRVRHTLDDFPPELKKKVTLLIHFCGYLHELVKKDKAAGRGSSSSIARAPAGDAAANGEGRDESRGEGVGANAGSSAQPLICLKKWLKTTNAILFRLSNRTVQVVFSDQTEILLSKEARAVTFVDKTGKRETRTLQRVLEEQRTDITKRVRYSKELIAQLLRRA